MIVAPIATGVSLALPKKYSPELSVLLSSLGVSCGIIGMYLEREGQPAPAWSMASIMFGLLSIAKSLELM